MRRRTLLAGAAAVAGAAGAAALVGGASRTPATPGGGLPTPSLPDRSGRPGQPGGQGQPALRRGVSLTHWFAYDQGQSVPPAELHSLRAAGFDHVRLPVDPVVGGWQPVPKAATASSAPAGMPPWLWPVRLALEAALDAALDAVFVLRLTPATRQLIEDQPALEASLVALWSDVGRALADLPPARLAFELFDAPQYDGRAGRRWPALQARLLAALRAQAPAHLVLLSGNAGGSLQGLRELPLVADAAVAYVFHHDEPSLFTHQGAAWLDTQSTTAGLRSNLFHPASAQGRNVPGLGQPHPRAAPELAAYLGTGGQPPQGSAERVRADIAAAGLLARQLGIRLRCNGFGAIGADVDPPSRYRLLADVRSALEEHGLGWTVRDDADIFGIAAASPLPPAQRRAPRSIEPAALQALGLAPAASTGPLAPSPQAAQR